jgi:acyl carrier protein
VKTTVSSLSAREQKLSMPEEELLLVIETKIKELLVSELNVSRAALAACSSMTPLLGTGIGLDSVETMALVLAIEQEFDISVPDSGLNATLFENLETLAKYVLHKVTEGR